jgi:hypothetical protein
VSELAWALVLASVSALASVQVLESRSPPTGSSILNRLRLHRTRTARQDMQSRVRLSAHGEAIQTWPGFVLSQSLSLKRCTQSPPGQHQRASPRTPLPHLPVASCRIRFRHDATRRRECLRRMLHARWNCDCWNRGRRSAPGRADYKTSPCHPCPPLFTLVTCVDLLPARGNHVQATGDGTCEIHYGLRQSINSDCRQECKSLGARARLALRRFKTIENTRQHQAPGNALATPGE